MHNSLNLLFKVTILSDSIVNNSLDSCISFPVFEELHQIALTAMCSRVLCCVLDLIVTMSAPPVPVGMNMDFCQPRYTLASTCERSALTSSCRTTYGGYTIQEWWVPSLQSFITCSCVFLRSASKAYQLHDRSFGYHSKFIEEFVEMKYSRIALDYLDA